MKREEEKMDRLLLEWELPEVPEMEPEIWRRISREENGAEVIVFRPLRGILTGAAAAALFMGALLGGIGLAEFQKERSAGYVLAESSEQAYFDSINPVALAQNPNHNHRR